MNKAELVARVAESVGITKREAAGAVDEIIAGIRAALQKNDKVTLVGFGTFRVRQRAARTGRNPQTGKEIKISARRVPQFRAGKALAKAVSR